METPFERAVMLTMDTFDKYSEKSGNKSTMRKRNLKELIQNEMHVGPKLQQPEYQSLMADLESHGNQPLSLDEFLSLVAKVLVTRDN